MFEVHQGPFRLIRNQFIEDTVGRTPSDDQILFILITHNVRLKDIFFHEFCFIQTFFVHLNTHIKGFGDESFFIMFITVDFDETFAKTWDRTWRETTCIETIAFIFAITFGDQITSVITRNREGFGLCDGFQPILIR